MTVLPDAFTTVAPCGTCTRARGPAAVMRSPLTRTTESLTAAAPVPSTSRAPTMAVTGPVAPRCAWGAAAKARSSVVHRVRALRLIVPPKVDCRRVLLRFGRDVSRWAATQGLRYRVGYRCSAAQAAAASRIVGGLQPCLVGHLQIRHRRRDEQPAALVAPASAPSCAERVTRALSVAMPVFAYIWR